MKYCSNCETTFYTWIRDHVINLSCMDTQMRLDTWLENYPEHHHPHCLLLLINEHVGEEVYLLNFVNYNEFSVTYNPKYKIILSHHLDKSYNMVDTHDVLVAETRQEEIDTDETETHMSGTSLNFEKLKKNIMYHVDEFNRKMEFVRNLKLYLNGEELNMHALPSDKKETLFTYLTEFTEDDFGGKNMIQF